MKQNMILGIIVVVILAAAVIGLLGFASVYSSTNNTATYTDGTIVFSYPSNMFNTIDNTTNSSNTVWNYTVSLSDNTTNIIMGKTSNFTNPQISSSFFISYLQSGNGQVVSNPSASINPNGVHVYRYAYRSNYTNVTYYYMDFANKDNSSVYSISVYGSDLIQSQTVANQIFNSLKLE